MYVFIVSNFIIIISLDRDMVQPALMYRITKVFITALIDIVWSWQLKIIAIRNNKGVQSHKRNLVHDLKNVL